MGPPVTRHSSHPVVTPLDGKCKKKENCIHKHWSQTVPTLQEAIITTAQVTTTTVLVATTRIARLPRRSFCRIRQAAPTCTIYYMAPCLFTASEMTYTVSSGALNSTPIQSLSPQRACRSVHSFLQVSRRPYNVQHVRLQSASMRCIPCDPYKYFTANGKWEETAAKRHAAVYLHFNSAPRTRPAWR